MLSFSRKLAGQFFKVTRRALKLKHSSYGRTVVALQGNSDGLRIRCTTSSVAVEMLDPTPQPIETIVVPLSLLGECGGKQSGDVTVEHVPEGRLCATWYDGEIPQLVQYDRPEPAPAFPTMPSEWNQNPPELLTALRQAMAITESGPSRFAIDHVRLRGIDGSIAATDGRQLFYDAGFHLPFESDVLLPKCSLFDCPELPRDRPVTVGAHDDWLALRIGPWTISWKMPSDLRFPRIDDLIQNDIHVTTLEVHDADARFACESLASFRYGDDAVPAITVDLNGSVAIRTRPAGRPRPVELQLTNSVRLGDEMRFVTDARYFRKALELGFRRFDVNTPKTTIICRNGQRRYVWMPLDPEACIRAVPDIDRIKSKRIARTETATCRPFSSNRQNRRGREEKSKLLGCSR